MSDMREYPKDSEYSDWELALAHRVRIEIRIISAAEMCNEIGCSGYDDQCPGNLDCTIVRSAGQAVGELK